MALKLSDSKSFKLEPVRKNRWIFEFSAIPGNDSAQAEALAFVASTCKAPELVFKDTTPINRMNEEFKYAGLPQWSDIDCTFFDFIRNTTGSSSSGGGREESAGEILYNWQSMIYNPLTGQMGYKTQYATSATLAQVDPAGNIIRAWNLFGIFPSKVNYGDFDYASADVQKISATFKYDLAVKVSDATSATESA